MEIITARFNRWDKDSIRPGPVGSVGDVNLQVMLKKSSPDMPERYDPKWSGKNEVWSGSNVSDGTVEGYTSGGRGPVVITRNFANNSNGNKTDVGWRMQNITPMDLKRETKMTPLGQYGWETLTGSVVRAKVSGEQFLPLPGIFAPTSVPRGSQIPRVVATSTGSGIALPPAEVDITNPIFGDTGIIPGCSKDEMDAVWVPKMDDPRRKDPNDKWLKYYPYRRAKPYEPGKPGAGYFINEYPEVAQNAWVYYLPGQRYEWIKTNPCGVFYRDKDLPAPDEITRPIPGNQDRRRQDKRAGEKRMR
jgi:hypothetical protein